MAWPGEPLLALWCCCMIVNVILNQQMMKNAVEAKFLVMI